MKAVNNKSLLAFIFDQMDKLDSGEIQVEQAKAQANLAKQANNALKYELDRVNTLIELDKHNRNTGGAIDLRNAESINFE